MIRDGFARWLQVTPLSARYGLPCAVAAVALPTAIRWAMDGVVTGCEFTPYLPFVLVSAILLRWWRAALVALASVAILGGLFVSPIHDLACFISSAAVFLGSSAAMIATVAVVRRIFAAIQQRGADGARDEIVFSLEDGEVWASWYGEGAPLRLGSQKKVSQMMKDFLAQAEVGKRLTNGRD
jgi:hypothetical protein